MVSADSLVGWPLPRGDYFLTIWYRRYEVQTQHGHILCRCFNVCAFSGLLAFAIQHMAGTAGLGGWRW